MNNVKLDSKGRREVACTGKGKRTSAGDRLFGRSTGSIGGLIEEKGQKGDWRKVALSWEEKWKLAEKAKKGRTKGVPFNTTAESSTRY